MEILNDIDKLINWFDKNFTNATIDKLHDCKSKLCIYNYRLVDIVAEYHLIYNKNYFIRKINIARRKHKEIANKSTVSKAETIATVEAADLFEKELESEATAKRLENLSKQINVIIRDIEQRISTMKIEQKQTNSDGQT